MILKGSFREVGRCTEKYSPHRAAQQQSKVQQIQVTTGKMSQTLPSPPKKNHHENYTLKVVANHHKNYTLKVVAQRSGRIIHFSGRIILHCYRCGLTGSWITKPKALLSIEGWSPVPYNLDFSVILSNSGCFLRKRLETRVGR